MFRKQDRMEPVRDSVQQLAPRQVYCRICDKETAFSQIWKRLSEQTYCMNCGHEFQEVAILYGRIAPRCPQCDEPLESRGFDYGLCDECTSKFELVPGTKPSWLPNQAQREEINKHGRSRNVLE